MHHGLPKLVTLALLALAISGCDARDQDAALKRALEEQASMRPARAAMSFGYIHELDGVDEGGPVHISSETGAEIEVREAFLVVSAIEAHLCEPKLARHDLEPGKNGGENSGEHGVWHRVFSLFLGEAFAHVPSSATRLGTPFVEDLLAPGRARIVGEISPPLGTYCRLYAVVSPADDDVLNLSGLDTGDIVEKSLLLRGRWRSGPGGEWQAFSSASEARDVVALEAIDPNSGERPLQLDDPSQTKMLLLDKTITPSLFSGLEPEQLDGPAGADLVLERLENTFRIRNFKTRTKSP